MKEADCLEYVQQNAIKGSPESVVKAIDVFCRSSADRWMMNVADDKGEIIDKLIMKHRPNSVVELGAYCGYSAVRFGALISSFSPDARYFSFEINAEFVDIARKMVEFAGLSHVVTFIHGPFDEQVESFKVDHKIVTIDLFFIDHWKDAYLPDLKLILEQNLLHSGSVVLADNVLKPGTPEYLDFVRNHPKFSYNETIHSWFEYSKEKDIKDAVQYSIYA